jgi:TP901 family phage tail tape measure protein
LVKRAVNSAVVEIKELDNVMTEIAVVTDMTQEDLWNQIAAYSAIAQQYGVSTKGVYEVSQLYYQQGLQTAEVMNLTTETLKMAKIAGLDYATATDYMTVAIRGFKLEMSDAQKVTDVYSALAAATASDTEELAVAMSKTASSAEAVGASFESTSAMIATMVSITREAPENIGSALKSIISRYGEMTTDPLKLVDAEGEEMSLNKVDKALHSVGISLQDTNGQFRDFDDVILELAESWDTIDTNTQRYIATIMAGNRQQSRFLALVGNVEEYKNALETAANAEDAGTLQYLKTMDSIETKLQQVKTAWEQFYSSMGIEDLFKGTLELITKIIQNINKLGKVQALGNLFSVFSGAKTLITSAFSGISKKVSDLMSKLAESRKLMEQKIELQANTEKIEQQIKNVAEQLE